MQREPAGQLARQARGPEVASAAKAHPHMAAERARVGLLHVWLVGQSRAGKPVRMLVMPKPQGHGHVEFWTMLKYGRLKLFTYDELRKATGDFDSS